MKFFIDSADIQEIKDAVTTGLVDGVTTNPSLVAKTGKSFVKSLEEICKIVSGPVSAEVTATDSQTMLEEGLKLSKIAPNITIKVPLTVEGLVACQKLREKDIMVNVTLCFSAAQALLAAKAGASFVSPFVGRLDDIGQDGLGLIAEIVDMYQAYPHYETEILVASVRSPLHVVESAKMGADVATLPPKTFRSLFAHPLTDKGLQAFLEDWAQTGQKILG